MTFTPKTKKELDESELWPKGEYDFECVSADKAISGPNSKTPGTQFIKLKLICYNADGGKRFVNAILHPAMERQVYNFCQVGKLTEKYEAGHLTHDDCVGVSGRCKLKVEEAKGDFPAKNSVADYVVTQEKLTPPDAAPAPSAPTSDDDVPF